MLAKHKHTLRVNAFNLRDKMPRMRSLTATIPRYVYVTQYRPLMIIFLNKTSHSRSMRKVEGHTLSTGPWDSVVKMQNIGNWVTVFYSPLRNLMFFVGLCSWI